MARGAQRGARRRVRTVGLLLCGAGLACGPAGDLSSRPGADVLLITVDTLRPDHLGIYGYPRPTSPNVDRWFADALRYDRAYSTSASTSPSVVSLLSGLLPPDHGVRLFYQLVPREVTLLPELLPDGYQTAAFVSNMVLTDEALGIADRFDHYDDFVAERESSRRVYERNATHTTDATLAWLGEGRDSERPLFLWVHYIDPHGPYRPPAHAPRSFDHEGDRPIPRKRVHPYQVRPGVDDALVYIDRYDEEIAYVDAEIGRLLDGYAARWPSEEALVLFTADHGESMMEHERWFTHGYQVYEEIVAVPLLVRGPGIAAGRVEHPTPGTAVASTILRFTGSPVPDALPPIDLRTGSGLSADGLVLVEATLEKHQWRAAIRGRRKWSMAIEGRSRQITAQRFYDLDLDPDEERQRSWALSEAPPEALVRAWRDDPDPAGIPETMREGMKLSAPKVNPNVGDDVRERLRGLGYVDPEGG